MTGNAKAGGQDATSPAPCLPGTWPERARQLQRLLDKFAEAKARATREHAAAYLAAEGPGLQREQAAKLAACNSVLAADYAKAEIEAYRLLIDAERLAGLQEPPL